MCNIENLITLNLVKHSSADHLFFWTKNGRTSLIVLNPTENESGPPVIKLNEPLKQLSYIRLYALWHNKQEIKCIELYVFQ